jgi:hypothetical protein
VRILICVAVWLFSFLTPAFAEVCSGCGCKGGPGYRDGNGRCVGWAQLNKACGTPPSSRCSAEGPALIALGKTALGIGGAANGAASAIAPTEALPVSVTTNGLKSKTPGLACAAPASLQALRACSSNTPTGDCAADRKAVVAAGTCVEIPAGTPLVVQAGSRSFDWLRVKLEGRAGEFWIDRGLALDR